MSMRKSSRTSCNYSDKDDSDSCTLCEAFQITASNLFASFAHYCGYVCCRLYLRRDDRNDGRTAIKAKKHRKDPITARLAGNLTHQVKKKEAQTLPPIVENEEAEVELKSMEKETQPPKPYTEGTLITAMKTAGKTLDNDEAQEILKEVEGIGTEATRANIIENLKQKHYIEVNKNEITVTPKGITLCKAVANEPLLTSAEMTARWEGYLRKLVNKRGHHLFF